MFALLQAFFQIVMRRLGPEDLPDSRLLVLLTLVAYIAMQTLPAFQVYGWSPVVPEAVVIDVALLTSALWLLLRITAHADRYRRTLTALLGTGALLTLPLIPLNFWLQVFTQAGHAPAGPSIAILILLAWSLMVQGHILSRALSSSFAVGLLLSIGYFVINYGVILQLSPLKP